MKTNRLLPKPLALILLAIWLGWTPGQAPAKSRILPQPTTEPFITLVPGSPRVYEQAAFVEEGYWLREELDPVGPENLGKGVTAIRVNAPLRKLSYWIQESVDGLYMFRTRRPLSFLGHITAHFEPPLKVIQFPMKEGDTWTYDGKAVTWIKNAKIHIDFVNRGVKTYRVGNRVIQAYRIDSKIKFGKLQPYYQISWYGNSITPPSKSLKVSKRVPLEPFDITTIPSPSGFVVTP